MHPLPNQPNIIIAKQVDPAVSRVVRMGFDYLLQLSLADSQFLGGFLELVNRPNRIVIVRSNQFRFL
jgi:hypothetical protein